MTAHDVRQLVICPICNCTGDRRNLIPTMLSYYHGKCYVKMFGEEKLLKLPFSHISALTINDIGIDLMRKLIKNL